MNCLKVYCPITIREGGTFDKLFFWYEGTDRTPVDLTGFSAIGAVKASASDPASSILIALTLQTGDFVEDGQTGVYITADDGDAAQEPSIRVYINDEDTTGICPLGEDIDGVWDMFLINASGESVLKLYGPAKIEASVSRGAS